MAGYFPANAYLSVAVGTFWVSEQREIEAFDRGESSKEYVKAQNKVGKAEFIGGSTREKGAEVFRKIIASSGRVMAGALDTAHHCPAHLPERALALDDC